MDYFLICFGDDFYDFDMFFSFMFYKIYWECYNFIFKLGYYKYIY